MSIEDGLLSTDSWTLIDDSEGLLLGMGNVTVKNYVRTGILWLTDMTIRKLFRVLSFLPVKFFTSAFGYWWSRYWNYLDDELRNLVTGCF